MNYAGEGTVEISDKAGNAVRLKVDEKTGMPTGESYAGPQGNVDESWSDWRDVNGIQQPFKIAVQQNNKKFADIAVQEIKVNTGATQAELSKRQ